MHILGCVLCRPPPSPPPCTTQVLFELLSNSGDDFGGVWQGTAPWTSLPLLAPPLPHPEGASHRRHLRPAATSDHLGLAHHTLLAAGLKRLAARLAHERDR